VTDEEYAHFQEALAAAINTFVPVESNLAIIQYNQFQRLELDLNSGMNPEERPTTIMELEHMQGLTS
jgi:hypothetical protein